jgi:hypothetical protein
MTALYLLAQDFREAAEKLADSDLPDEVIQDTLESLQFPVEEKAKHVAFVIRNMEASAKAIKEAADAMLLRAKAEENRAKHLKGYLQSAMLATGISKVECPYFVLSIRNNPESVVIDAESQIPQDYMREIPATYAPDKALIKKAIQDGFTVPGCHLTRTQSLSIK